MKRFAIFVSGNGTNMENIVKAVQEEKIKNGEVGFIFSNRKDAFALERAKKLGIKSVALAPREFPSKKEYEQEILKYLIVEKIDFIVLAGYMRLVGETILNAFPNKVLNIHPALLPHFPGLDGIGDAYKAGAKETGVTVHIADAGVDTGPVVLQKALPVHEGESLDDLTERVHALEYELYPKAIQMMINGEI